MMDTAHLSACTQMCGAAGSERGAPADDRSTVDGRVGAGLVHRFLLGGDPGTRMKGERLSTETSPA